MYVPIENEVFHVHTKRCGHAGNYEDREYVENKQTIPQMDGVGSDLYLHVQHGLISIT